MSAKKEKKPSREKLIKGLYFWSVKNLMSKVHFPKQSFPGMI